MVLWDLVSAHASSSLDVYVFHEVVTRSFPLLYTTVYPSSCEWVCSFRVSVVMDVAAVSVLVLVSWCARVCESVHKHLDLKIDGSWDMQMFSCKRCCHIAFQR